MVLGGAGGTKITSRETPGEIGNNQQLSRISQLRLETWPRVESIEAFAPENVRRTRALGFA